ncbi:MAG: glycoside hydrolase family 3 C-terminal domain-containing protein, partial [Prevotella sp.]|nr:glycoside hydrolase family 3 C-terminal domain-containing protein [Prevotella sp.]
LKAVYATGTPVVLVLINGRPLSINWADRNVPAILEAWYPGSQGGTAIADVLFGDYNPGGKLTVTFPKSVGQIPFNFPSKPSAQVDGGNTLGLTGNASRVNGALYYFGHGISYTDFKYSNLRLSSKVIAPTDSIIVSCDITNTGQMEGDEVAQLYTHDVLSSVTTYEKNLRGFERIHLAPGETKTVSFKLVPENLQLLDKDFKLVVEPGDFKIMVGSSSEDIRLTDTFNVSGDDGSRSNVASLPFSMVAQPISSSLQYLTDGNPSTFWTAEKDNSLTISVPATEKTNALTFVWADSSTPDAEFVVQISSGGGQFLDAYTGKISGQKYTLNINRSGVSDIRLICKQGKLNVSEVIVDK